MEKDALTEFIKKRLALEGEELSAIVDNPKNHRMFENISKAARYRLVAEVVASKSCNSGHTVGQRIVFDSAGNIITRDSPHRICAFLMPNLTVLINAFFENMLNGDDPKGGIKNEKDIMVIVFYLSRDSFRMCSQYA